MIVFRILINVANNNNLSTVFAVHLTVMLVNLSAVHLLTAGLTPDSVGLESPQLRDGILRYSCFVKLKRFPVMCSNNSVSLCID